jgi:solute carrier family 35 (UDP-sugar transporter), member A1/2/3
VTLTAQNTALALLGRYTRTRAGDMFYSSTAVVFSELLKMLTCLCIVTMETGSLRGCYEHLHRYVFTQPLDNVKIMVPALLYVIQNNLIYVSMSNLDAATYQVTYQLKILTTALLSVAMLHKRLSVTQWLSLVILFAGVSIVQLQPVNETAAKHVATEQHPLVGLFAIVCACMLSGFAGVYFEKLLKNTEQSVWVRNIQLGT